MRLIEPINVSATDEVRNILSSLNSSLDFIYLMDLQRSREWEGAFSHLSVEVQESV